MAREGTDLSAARHDNFKSLLACMISPKAPNEFVTVAEANSQFNAMVLEYCKQMTTTLREQEGSLNVRDTDYGKYDTQDFFGNERETLFKNHGDVLKVYQNQRAIFNAIKSMLDSQDRTLLATIMNFDQAQAASKSDEEVKSILDECKPYLFSSISTAAALTGNYALYSEIKGYVPSIDTPQQINIHSRLAYKHVLGVSGVLSTENYLPSDARFVLDGVKEIVISSLNLGSETPLPEGSNIERLTLLLLSKLITDTEFNQIITKIKQSERVITVNALSDVINQSIFWIIQPSKEIGFNKARAYELITTIGDILKSKHWDYNEIVTLKASLQHAQIASIDRAKNYLEATFEDIFTRFMIDQINSCSDKSEINELQNKFNREYVGEFALDEQLTKKIQDLFEREPISLAVEALSSEGLTNYTFSFISDAISGLGRLLSSTFNAIIEFFQQQFNGRPVEGHYGFAAAAEVLSSAESSIQPPPSSLSPS